MKSEGASGGGGGGAGGGDCLVKIGLKEGVMFMKLTTIMKKILKNVGQKMVNPLQTMIFL